jgi:hypothetical protein
MEQVGPVSHLQVAMYHGHHRSENPLSACASKMNMTGVSNAKVGAQPIKVSKSVEEAV